MTGALFCKPLPFQIVAANETTQAPAKWLNKDEPGLVWRSVGRTGVYVTVQLTQGTTFNTIALAGYSGAAGDQIRVRAGSNPTDIASNSGLPLDQSFSAWSGVAPASGSAIVLKQLANSVTAPYVRIDFMPVDNALWVQASRLIIGQAVVCDGVDIGAEQTVEDASTVEDVLGSTSVDEYRIRSSWKVDVSAINEAAYYANWWSFMLYVGNSKGFLFAPDSGSAYFQNQAVFGRMSASAKGSSVSGDTYAINMTVKSV